jgi:DNA modification methylase
MIDDQWWSCYGASLKGIITDSSYAHPAKYSWGLINRIYAHAFEEGWVQRGSLVVDPMAGVAIGGVAAAMVGLRWFGLELEPRFVTMGRENIALHAHEWVALGKPLPYLHQGDARNLRQIISAAGLVVSSPPYADSAVAHVDGNVSGRPGGTLRNRDKPVSDARHAVGYSQPSAIVSSPPFLDARQNTTPSIKGKSAPTKHDPEAWSQLSYQPACVITSPPYSNQGIGHEKSPESEKDLPESIRRRLSQSDKAGRGNYGSSPAQLGAMREGSLADVIVTSPPYAGSQQVDARDKPASAMSDTWRLRQGQITVGTSDGQLGAMREGSLADVIVTSPPYAETRIGPRGDMSPMVRDKFQGRTIETVFTKYGVTDGQLGACHQETYWSEMAKVYAACYDVLPVGGHLILVLKSFVRRGAIVDLPMQTAQLLDHVGFTVLHYHRAMLSSPVGQSRLFDDGEDRTSRKSFFRRLHEKKHPDQSIDYEVVLCAVKP